MYEPALPYIRRALKIARATPDAGYPFLTYEQRLDALIGLKETTPLRTLAADILKHAREQHRPAHQGQVLIQAAGLALARNENTIALSDLDQCLALSNAAGLERQQEEA